MFNTGDNTHKMKRFKITANLVKINSNTYPWYTRNESRKKTQANTSALPTIPVTCNIQNIDYVIHTPIQTFVFALVNSDNFKRLKFSFAKVVSIDKLLYFRGLRLGIYSRVDILEGC